MPCNTNMNISQEVTVAFFFFSPLAYFLRNYSEKKFFYSGQHNVCAAKMGLSLSRALAQRNRPRRLRGEDLSTHHLQLLK